MTAINFKISKSRIAEILYDSNCKTLTDIMSQIKTHPELKELRCRIKKSPLVGRYEIHIYDGMGGEEVIGYRVRSWQNEPMPMDKAVEMAERILEKGDNYDNPSCKS